MIACGDDVGVDDTNIAAAVAAAVSDYSQQELCDRKDTKPTDLAAQACSEPTSSLSRQPSRDRPLNHLHHPHTETYARIYVSVVKD